MLLTRKKKNKKPLSLPICFVVRGHRQARQKIFTEVKEARARPEARVCSMVAACENTQYVQSALFASTKYADSKYMSAKEKERAFKCFKRVLEARDINKMDRNLYEHLHLHCGFSAQFNIHGFKATYSGQNFRRFVERFDRNSKVFQGWNHWVDAPDYSDINNDMVDLATELAPTIYAELKAKEKAVEIELCRAVAEKHGFKVVPKNVDVFVIVLLEGGLVASTWVVQGTADHAIKTAKNLAAELDLNPEEHDLAVERPFVVRPDRETTRNSERIWTWDPDDSGE